MDGAKEIERAIAKERHVVELIDEFFQKADFAQVPRRDSSFDLVRRWGW